MHNSLDRGALGHTEGVGIEPAGDRFDRALRFPLPPASVTDEQALRLISSVKQGPFGCCRIPVGQPAVSS
jgi:hypothetical protein